jgi:hypothetical protein
MLNPDDKMSEVIAVKVTAKMKAFLIAEAAKKGLYPGPLVRTILYQMYPNVA